MAQQFSKPTLHRVSDEPSLAQLLFGARNALRADRITVEEDGANGTDVSVCRAAVESLVPLAGLVPREQGRIHRTVHELIQAVATPQPIAITQEPQVLVGIAGVGDVDPTFDEGGQL